MVTTNTSGINFSDVPTVTVELGNMRNGADARLMSSEAGRAAYARGLMAGLRDYFSRG
jgi:N-acetylmuramoyl-L-alanine amidase